MRLRVEIFNGKEFCSIVEDNDARRESDWRVEKGLRKYQKLTEEQAVLPLDKLIEMFFACQFEVKPQNFSAEVDKARVKRNDLLRRLDGIIKTSEHQGEINNCKGLWKKLLNKEWPER